MLIEAASLRVFVAVEAVDFRRGFDGLASHVREVLQREVLEGGLFVFTNRRRNRLRLLWWDGGGRWVAVGRVTVAADLADPVPEIMRSFRRAEISESEKNALLSLVCDTEEAVDCCAETACVHDEWADEHETSSDDE